MLEWRASSCLLSILQRFELYHKHACGIPPDIPGGGKSKKIFTRLRSLSFKVSKTDAKPLAAQTIDTTHIL